MKDKPKPTDEVRPDIQPSNNPMEIRNDNGCPVINEPKKVRFKFRVVWNSAISRYQIQHQGNDCSSWLFGWETSAAEFETLEEAEEEMNERDRYWNR